MSGRLEKRPPYLVIGTVIAVSLLICASLASALGEARAQFDEAMLGLGAGLLEVAEAPRDAVRDVLVNGQRLRLATHTVEGSLGAVLADLRSSCESRDAGLAETLSFLAPERERTATRGLLTRVATTTGSGEDEGYAACIDLGKDRISLDALATRVRQALSTGVLGALGVARYAYVRRVSKAPARTFVLTFQTFPKFDLFGFIPANGSDAAGGDLAGVPRPAGAQRILSAVELEAATSMVTYRVGARTPLDMQSFYRRELLRTGWKPIAAHVGEQISVGTTRIVAVERSGQTVIVLITPRRDSELFVTILRTGEA